MWLSRENRYLGREHTAIAIAIAIVTYGRNKNKNANPLLRNIRVIRKQHTCFVVVVVVVFHVFFF